MTTFTRPVILVGGATRLAGGGLVRMATPPQDLGELARQLDRVSLEVGAG
jgi:hypothetical protein